MDYTEQIRTARQFKYDAVGEQDELYLALEVMVKLADSLEACQKERNKWKLEHSVMCATAKDAGDVQREMMKERDEALQEVKELEACEIMDTNRLETVIKERDQALREVEGMRELVARSADALVGCKGQITSCKGAEDIEWGTRWEIVLRDILYFLQKKEGV